MDEQAEPREGQPGVVPDERSADDFDEGTYEGVSPVDGQPEQHGPGRRLPNIATAPEFDEGDYGSRDPVDRPGLT